METVFTQENYDVVVQSATFIINCLLFFIAYLCFRRARISNGGWKVAFQSAGAGIGFIAVARAAAQLIYGNDPILKFVTPITAVLLWGFIGFVMWVSVRRAEAALGSKEKREFTDEVFVQTLIPLVNGEKIPAERIKHYRQKSTEMAQYR